MGVWIFWNTYCKEILFERGSMVLIYYLLDQFVILGLETHLFSVMDFRYLMFQPSVQEIECNLSPEKCFFFQ